MTGYDSEPNSSPRLEELGFIHDPFSYSEAEKMPKDLDLWERLFVKHPGFDRIRDTNQSAALLAERGGGKTAHRLYFSYMLAAQHPNWLVINHDSFVSLAEELPNITTSDHFKALMSCIAKALIVYVQKQTHKETFLEKHLVERRWFWGFLNAYLYEEIQFELKDNSLRTDFEVCEDPSLTSPFQQNIPLDTAIKSIVKHLNSLGIERLFFLVDGIDGSDEFKDIDDMAALVNPLLNGLSLLSIPGVIWKFFLPQSLERTILDSSGYKTGRLYYVPIKWDSNSLIEFLNARLNWASKQPEQPALYQRVEDLCSQEVLTLTNVEGELIKIAVNHPYLGPPRALLQLTDKLVHQSEFCNGRISLKDWEAFHQRIQTHQEREEDTKNKQPKIDRAKFVDLLDTYFNLNDLKRLCFELKVDYDNIEGSIKRSKIENLYLRLERESRLSELIDRARRHRPKAPWNDVFFQ